MNYTEARYNVHDIYVDETRHPGVSNATCWWGDSDCPNQHWAELYNYNHETIYSAVAWESAVVGFGDDEMPPKNITQTLLRRVVWRFQSISAISRVGWMRERREGVLATALQCWQSQGNGDTEGE